MQSVGRSFPSPQFPIAPECIDEAGGWGAVEAGGLEGGVVVEIERGADVVGAELRGLAAVVAGLRAMA